MATSPSGAPVSIVCVGMAGSGKTTFMQRINAYLHSKKEPPYVINLDPAVRTVPFDSNIDIRDSVNYREVMKQYNLGPNGGIITSLNLFATKIDQILALLEKRTHPPAPPTDGAAPAAAAPQAKPIKNILVDTPGQIEVFVWSASGDILLGSLASSFPTVVAYIIDTPRTTSTSTFMSNMLYACSIMYKTKLPMILVMNKTDVKDADFVKEWMTDFEAFQAALREEENGGGFGGLEGGEGPVGGGSGYMGSLLNSMSLMLEEFYRHLSVVGVSSMTGAGVDEFFEAVKEKAAEFERDYKPELEKRREERAKEKEERREKELDKLMRDMNVGGASNKTPTKAKGKGRRKEEPETISDLEDEDEEDEGPAADSDDFEEDDDAEDGLQSRYQKALKDEHDRAGGGDDMSFARYVTQARMG
ncbi:putative atpase npa3 protein [Neofusicoccum parvum UCRNP2]|uniref:GPN-loop GTPase n=1 Tax=Botryosphaeria parva (strain UCR-NP2) TaxID=1287680 RepID=R1GCW8_BOTPV|nr:putative atpase npa3 protein [Neofusicoccum parvum UCRNP2]